MSKEVKGILPLLIPIWLILGIHFDDNRQKSSGAEGERLKEATNINKSLSTLGLVILTDNLEYCLLNSIVPTRCFSRGVTLKKLIG